MKFEVKFLFIILISWQLMGCISNKDLTKQVYESPQSLKPDIINGIYSNTPDSSNRIDLWSMLYVCNTFKLNKINYSKTAVVKLRFENSTLIAELIDSNRVVNKITLEAKLKENFIRINRNYRLIPIPFICFVYHEAKALLYIQTDGSLGISYSRHQFLWIIFGGSVNEDYSCSFRKISTP